MFCPKCGNEVQEGQAFCGKCGTPVGSTVNQRGTTAGAPAPKKNSAKIGIIVAAVAVVLLVVIGFAANGFGLGGVQPKGAVDVPIASQEPQAEDAGAAASEDLDAEGDSQGTAEQDGMKSSVEAYTWDELSQISAEIAAAGDEAAGIEVAKKYNLCTPDGKLDGTQVKSVTLTNGAQTTVQIIGFNHDDKTGGGKAGITFIFGDAITEMAMNSTYTNVGWEASQLRGYLNSDGMGLLPQDLTEKIVAVDKLTNNVGETTNVLSVSTTSDMLWLPSGTELCGTIDWFSNSICNDVLNAEGSEYQLYRDSGVEQNDANSILVKNLNGADCGWWERSPHPDGSGYFMGVTSGGDPSNYASVTLFEGVVPGFCI